MSVDRDSWFISGSEYDDDILDDLREEIEDVDEFGFEESDDDEDEQSTSMDLDLSWDTAFAPVVEDGPDTSKEENSKEDKHKPLPDILVRCLLTKGYVDMEYILQDSKLPLRRVLDDLRGSIFLNPERCGILEQDYVFDIDEVLYRGWETADEYLAGNLRDKLKSVNEVLSNPELSLTLVDCFTSNKLALLDIMPPQATSEDIYVTIGSPWLPADVIEEFTRDVVSTRTEVKRDDITGIWEVKNPLPRWQNFGYSYEYATRKIDFIDLLEKTLNLQTIAIYEEVKSDKTKSGKKRVLNESETILALEKQKKLIADFRSWVWSSAERTERLEKIYNDRYASVKGRRFDGSFLEFPEMAEGEALLGYQKNAVARILFSPNTLLAHDVGAGKTYVMIAAGMELKRMGLSKKNLYVVPNNIIGQWNDLFRRLYPNAKVLLVNPKSFVPDKRQDVLEDIRDGQWDAVIMAYSCFELVPLSKSAKSDELRAELKKYESTGSLSKSAQAKVKGLNKSLQEITLGKVDKKTGEIVVDKYNGIFFDELGFTRMFVDEAHNFKNVPIDTRITKVLGLNPTGSTKCQQMLDKVHYIQKINGGRGIVMATGTPITNSITDVFILQRYLQEAELTLVDLQHFDSWVGMFAERKTEFEIDVDTSSYRLTTRLTQFHNLPELTALLGNIADFHQVDVSAGIPDFDGYTDVTLPRSFELSDYLKFISERAEKVRNHDVSSTEDNMLKITTDGRKAALDIRLVNEDVPYSSLTKVAKCAEAVFKIYMETITKRSTQLIFCDTSTPKATFNIYDELKKRLVGMGVDEAEIAYIHDANTESKRMWLFEQVKTGEIRILIGSTFKLGLGVNVQDKLIALHHIDVPWRPADMVQREGRILRQGNENPTVQIYRYITEGSFDAYSWQLLETKQRFIADLLSGSLEARNSSDIENTVLNYAEVKALAVGNPLIKRRVELANELSRYITLQRKCVENRLANESDEATLTKKIHKQEQLIADCESDVEFLAKEKAEADRRHKEREEKLSEAKELIKREKDFRAKMETITDEELIAKTEAEFERARSVVSNERDLREEEATKRRSLRAVLYKGVLDNAQSGKDIEFMSYRGFKIIFPSNMLAGNPVIILKRQSEYKFEIGNSESGQIVRIDNYLDNLSEKLEAYRTGLSEMQERLAKVKAQLKKDENYTNQIEFYKKQIADVDKELGVKWVEE